MTNKKKGGIAAGIATLFTAATLLFFGISGETVIEIPYTIEEGSMVTSMLVQPPEELSSDVIELYCNDELVTKAVLPNGKLTSIPFIFTNLENLEIRFYKEGEVVGIGNFEGKKLYGAIKDGVLEEVEGNEK